MKWNSTQMDVIHCTLFLLHPGATGRPFCRQLPRISGPAQPESVRLFQILAHSPHQAPRAASCSQASAPLTLASSIAPAEEGGGCLTTKQPNTRRRWRVMQGRSGVGEECCRRGAVWGRSRRGSASRSAARRRSAVRRRSATRWRRSVTSWGYR